MQKKYLHWFNLAAYLVAVLVQAFSLAPVTSGSATSFSALTGECGCGCAIDGNTPCCCGCPADGNEKLTGRTLEGASENNPSSVPGQYFLSPAGCVPAGESMVLPSPLPDHLASSADFCSPPREPAGSLPGPYEISFGILPDNPDKIPI